MNLQAILFNSTLVIVAGFGTAGAIAAQPETSSQGSTEIAQRTQTPRTAQVVESTQAVEALQRLDLCRQAGADYRQLYVIDEETRSITICQKNDEYYYVNTAK